MDLMKEKLEISEEFLSKIVSSGYSNVTLKECVIARGLSENLVEILFPGGANDIFAKFLEDKYESFLSTHNPDLIKEMRVKDRIKFLVLRYISELEPSKLALKEIVRHCYEPKLFISNLKVTWEVVSAIWYMAGDESTDFNYYTKRFLLTCVFLPTVLYWLNSEDASDNVENFLDSMLVRVNKIGKLKSFIKEEMKIKNIPILRMFRR